MKKISSHYDLTMYPKEALLKAAYSFIKEVYVHLETLKESQQYIVTFVAKENADLSETICSDFENELLAQTVRYQVYKQTHTIREVLMARAMSSTMTMDEPNELFNQNDSDISNLDEILEDWFTHERNTN